MFDQAVATGLEIARARRKAGLTQAAMASALGTTQSAVSRAEAGRVLPRLTFLRGVAECTGVPLAKLVDPRPLKPSAAVKRVLGRSPFDPLDRNPTSLERRSLAADGLIAADD